MGKKSYKTIELPVKVKGQSAFKYNILNSPVWSYWVLILQIFLRGYLLDSKIPVFFCYHFFFFKFLGNHCSNLDFCGMPRPCGQPQCTLYVILFSSTVLLQIAVCIWNAEIYLTYSEQTFSNDQKLAFQLPLKPMIPPSLLFPCHGQMIKNSSFADNYRINLVLFTSLSFCDRNVL